jgi:hypothetical protein
MTIEQEPPDRTAGVTLAILDQGYLVDKTGVSTCLDREGGADQDRAQSLLIDYDADMQLAATYLHSGFTRKERLDLMASRCVV